MDALPTIRTLSERQAVFVSAIERLVPDLQARAAAFDDAGGFPVADIEALGAAGAMHAPFPAANGGLGLGTEPGGAAALCEVLCLLGRGNLAVGRLYEAHVNAVRLISRGGTGRQTEHAAADALAGHLFGLWVTDPPADALHATADGVWRGGKAYCSGAGHVRRAVVTAGDIEGATRLAYVSAEHATVKPLGGGMQGMRATVTGQVSFSGLPIAPDCWIGAADDYMREPDFSAGAWRTSAVTCGGLEALVEAAISQLIRRGHADSPHQKERMGRAWIARRTARFWVDHAAGAAECAEPFTPPDEIISTIGFARIAIEAACMEAIAAVERSVGLAAFMRPGPIERIRRDLATYLRQPAPDEVLTEAAAYIMRTLTRTG